MRLHTAFHRSEGYFTLGNCYTQWFNGYGPFLNGLGVAFQTGTACHTDYLSPFATVRGIGQCTRQTYRRLAEFGYGLWLRSLEQLPSVEVIVGHGGGWRAMPSLLSFPHWHSLPTPYDAKGGRANIAKPYLLWASATLPNSGRTVRLYWWQPDRDGMPLAWLNGTEKHALGEMIRDHAEL